MLDSSGRSNLQALQDNINRSSGSAPAASSGPPVRIEIRRFEVAGTKLSADVSAVGGKNYETNLAPVTRSNIGGSAGASPAEIAKVIVAAFVEATVSAVARTEAQHQLDKLIDKKLGGGDLGDAAKGLVDGLLGN